MKLLRVKVTGGGMKPIPRGNTMVMATQPAIIEIQGPNGDRIPAVSSITIQARPNSLPVVTFTCAAEVDIDLLTMITPAPVKPTWWKRAVDRIRKALPAVVLGLVLQGCATQARPVKWYSPECWEDIPGTALKHNICGGKP